MSNRIDTVFAALKQAGRTAVVPYICCGDPYADATVDVMLALAQGGADVIELGVPFSDPMADGPVIQKASERALARGIGTPQVLDAVRAFRVRDAASAKAVAQVSDAVVIGSALVQCLEVLPRDQVADGARRFIAGIRSAVDEVRKA